MTRRGAFALGVVTVFVVGFLESAVDVVRRRRRMERDTGSAKMPLLEALRRYM
jgi:hypothetical protein